MTPTLELDLRAPDTLRAAVEAHLPVGGLLLETDTPPAMFTTVDIAIRLTDGDFRFLKGQVVNHAPRGVFAVLSDTSAAASLLEAAQALLDELPDRLGAEDEPGDDRRRQDRCEGARDVREH